ncbi:MAG: polymerase polC-type [Actinomycetota bacterium]|jgi:DNA polymerase III epsilon subunit family exonuclease
MDQPEATPIAETVFAVVDLETTGFNPQKDRIVQMAALLVNGRGEVVDSFDTVVKPESPEQYEHGAEHVHGISREMVQNGMPLRDALSHMWSLTDGRVFTAHNARFDISFLEAESERVGMKREVRNFLDTLALAREADSDRQRKHSLQALCEHYGVAVERAHEAMSDAKATATILMKLIDELGVESTDQLPGLSSE